MPRPASSRAAPIGCVACVSPPRPGALREPGPAHALCVQRGLGGHRDLVKVTLSPERREARAERGGRESRTSEPGPLPAWGPGEPCNRGAQSQNRPTRAVQTPEPPHTCPTAPVSRARSPPAPETLACPVSIPVACTTPPGLERFPSPDPVTPAALRWDLGERLGGRGSGAPLHPTWLLPSVPYLLLPPLKGSEGALLPIPLTCPLTCSLTCSSPAPTPREARDPLVLKL